MRNLTLALFIVLTLTTTAAPASILWNWNYSAPGISAGGTFTTVETPDPHGGYLITAITGTRNQETITGLQPPGTSIPGNEPFVVDNLVFLGPGPQLTGDGFGFSTSGGNFSNPFFASFLPTPGYLEFFSMPPSNSHTELSVHFAASPVPEPATYILILGGLAIAVFRSRSLREPL
jgi:hypothetical protein